MKVLSLCFLKPDKYGGFERYLIDFTVYLKNKGHEHHMWFCCEPVDEVKCALIESGGKYRVIKEKDLDLPFSWELFWRINAEKYDIVHMHFYKIFSPLSCLLSFSSARVFSTYHMSGAPAKIGSVKREMKRLRSKTLGRGVDKVFCVSGYNRNKFINDYVVPEKKTEVVYNGINLAHYNKNRSIKYEKPIEVIFVGYLIEEKGVQDLIRAAEKISHLDFKINIVGSGPYEEALVREAESLDINNKVFFLGRRNDVPSLLALSDIAVVPSLWEEACAYTVIEGTASGLPVVATDVGGNPELVSDGENGFIVRAGDLEALSNKLQLLIEDHDLRLAMGQKSKIRAEKKFNIKRVFDQQIDAYMKS